MYYVDGSTELPPNYYQSHDVTARISRHCYATICSFLSHEDVYTASKINEHWRRSFVDQQHWEGALQRQNSTTQQNSTNNNNKSTSNTNNPSAATSLVHALPQTLQAQLTASPILWHHCIRFVQGEFRQLARQLRDEESFFKIIVTFGSGPQSLYSVQFPLLLISLHNGALLSLRTESCGKEGYIVKPKYALFIANTIRWHESSPSEMNIPWLLELYAWAATNGPALYDPTLMLPALSLLTRTPVSVDAVVRVLELTKLMLLRYYMPQLAKGKIPPPSLPPAPAPPTAPPPTAAAAPPSNSSKPTAANLALTQSLLGVTSQPSLWIPATPTSSIFSVFPLILARYRQHNAVLDAIDDCLSLFDDGRGLDESLRSIAQHIATTEFQFYMRREKKSYFAEGCGDVVPDVES